MPCVFFSCSQLQSGFKVVVGVAQCVDIFRDGRQDDVAVALEVLVGVLQCSAIFRDGRQHKGAVLIELSH